jgi:hypothetical protein
MIHLENSSQLNENMVYNAILVSKARPISIFITLCSDGTLIKLIIVRNNVVNINGYGGGVFHRWLAFFM